jgi:hypothetical protein
VLTSAETDSSQAPTPEPVKPAQPTVKTVFPETTAWPAAMDSPLLMENAWLNQAVQVPKFHTMELASLHAQAEQ